MSPVLWARKATAAIEELRFQLRAALALNIGERVAIWIERAIFWLGVLAFAIAAALAVYQATADACEEPTLSAAELMHYGRPAPDEDQPAFVARMRGYDRVMRAASAKVGKHGFSPRVNLALLIAKGSFESKFDRRVCEDLDRTTAPGKPAVGCWQSEIHDPLTVAQAARFAVIDLNRAGAYCQAKGFDPIVGAISLYATGQTCEWEGAEERAARFRGVYWRIGR